MGDDVFSHCSVCSSEVDLEGRGGISGYWGMIPVVFCEWCLSSMQDMMSYLGPTVRCKECGEEVEDRNIE